MLDAAFQCIDCNLFKFHLTPLEKLCVQKIPREKLSLTKFVLT